MAWQTPKTNWQAGDIPGAGDFNRIESNIAALLIQLNDIDNVEIVDFPRGVAYVIRNFVHLRIAGGAGVEGNLVTTLPSSIRPINNIYGVALTFSSGQPFGSTSKLFQIDTEGIVWCYNKSRGEDVHISAFYIKG